MRGSGIRYRLQGFVPEFGRSVLNGFHVRAWREATDLASFGVELFVESGAVFVSLKHVEPDGQIVEVCKIEQGAGGSSYSPPLFVRDFEGLLVPVVENAAEDAVFDIYFGTNQTPSFDFGVTGFVATATDRDRALSVAKTFADFVTEYHARSRARLVLVVGSGVTASEIPVHPCIFVVEQAGNGVNLAGRGVFECAYGALRAEELTHVCVLGHLVEIDAELFVRACGFAWYSKEGTHLSAPVYRRSEQTDKLQPLPFGYKLDDAGSAERRPIIEGIDPDDAGTMLTLDADWDYAAAGVLLFDIIDLHRAGLPHPFLQSPNLAEFQLRLKRARSAATTPLSLFAVRANDADMGDDAAERTTVHLLHRQGAQPLQPVIVPDSGKTVERSTGSRRQPPPTAAQELERQIRAYSTDSFKYTDQPPARRSLAHEILKRFVKSEVEPSPTAADLRADYERLFQWASTSTFWSRLTDPADFFRFPMTYGPEAQFDIRQHNTLAATSLQLETQRRELRKLIVASSEMLVNRLGGHRYLDEGGYREDLERANRMTLSLLRNRHAGRRAFVIGNGPSLKIEDLDRLKGEVTFASNKIYLAYNQTSWRPTYYSVEDHLVMRNNREQIAALTGSIKIFPSNLRDFGYHQADTLFIPLLPPKSFAEPLSDLDFPEFSLDLSHGSCWGSTITYTMIQLAVYMGASEIVLIGLDHSYHLPSVRVGSAYVAENEINHFHPDYRAKGEIWHQPNLDVLEASYRKARTVCERMGIRIVNASRQTQLDIFERADLDEILN